MVGASIQIRILTLCLICLAGRALADNTAHLRTDAKSKAVQEMPAITELAARYENGEGVSQDYPRALALYCQAADSGDANAFLSLGWMYMNGRGVAIDDGIAAGWLKKAADRGIAQAANLLRMIAASGPSMQTGCPSKVAHRNAPTPEINRIIIREAAKASVDPKLVRAIIEIESNFNPRAISVRNAQGLMQLLPETAARFHVRDTFDPQQNIRGGTAYVRWLLDRFGGDLKLTLAAYNAGENAVAIHQGLPDFPETKKYVADVTNLYLSALDLPTDTVSFTGSGLASSMK